MVGHATVQHMCGCKRTTCRRQFSPLPCEFRATHSGCQACYRHLYPLSHLDSAKELWELFTHKSLLPAFTAPHNTWVYCCTFIYPSFPLFLPSPLFIHCSFFKEKSTLDTRRGLGFCWVKVLNLMDILHHIHCVCVCVR